MPNQPSYSITRYTFAWSVHLFTALGSIIGLLTLIQITQNHFITAFKLMGLTIFIDAVDGALARKAQVKTILPNIDGALMDNIVDYFNYVLTPCFLLLIHPSMLPPGCAIYLVGLVAIASLYQFCQLDAKTPDHFFKGFPCYWNLVVFYFFILSTSAVVNASILTLFAIMVFIPIKYLYPSRLEFLTSSIRLRYFIHVCSVIYGLSLVMLLFQYPTIHWLWLSISIVYISIYVLISLWKTLEAKRKGARGESN